MLKNNLREQGYSVVEKFPKHSKINTLWGILTLIFIIGTFSGLFFLADPPQPGDNRAGDDAFIKGIENIGSALTLGMLDSEVAGYFIFAVLMLFLYLILKLFMTILFCHKSESIKMKLLENKGMPICYCREALRVWQTVLIYFVPFAVIYSLYLYLCVRYIDRPAFMLMTFFMLFFMVFDLTLVIYVLCIKVKEKPDYISIDHHIFGYTLYRETYVKFSNKNKKAPSRFLRKGNEKNIENGKFNWKN